MTTVLLPAVVVFGAEVVRHELLHGLVPEMLGNVLTGAAALIISALILLPIYRRLEAVDARLRTTEIEHAVSHERERLARELHDGISQALFFLNVKATALERSLAASDLGPARQIADEIAETVRDTSRHVRDAIFDLRTSPEPGQPLGTWVRAYVSRFGEIHSLAGTVEEVGSAVRLPLESEFHAMAIVREALHNVAKHAHARSVAVRIDWGVDRISMAISDDGTGVPEPIPGPAQGRFGLAALRDHARIAGGTVTVSRGARGGTAVVFQMPYSGTHARSA
jgi:signal transduction histidine kinase